MRTCPITQYGPCVPTTGESKGGAIMGVERAAKAVDLARGRVKQTAADADQTSADADQTSSDSDQTGSAIDLAGAASDQRASDHDQAIADREHAAGSHTLAEDSAYDAARAERQSVAAERRGTRDKRVVTARDRDDTANARDRVAEARDAGGEVPSGVLPDTSALAEHEALLLRQLEALAAEAAADRARAAADRARAATDRANAARERARLQAELDRAHLDELTGAFRREMGQQALANEIDRARRYDGRFVLAFVDVDDLKLVNDRDGHAAGDRALQDVVQTIRSRLRSFDPIIRFGGDEFVCGLPATDLLEATFRFDAIRLAVAVDAHVGISVGLAALAPGDTVDTLTERADAAMLAVKAQHRSRKSSQPGSDGPADTS
jgi:diguanylate cyclase (GGDEF)-like protein